MEVLKNKKQFNTRVSTMVVAGIMGISAIAAGTFSTSVSAFAAEEVYEVTGEVVTSKKYNSLVDEDYCETFFTNAQQQAELQAGIDQVLNQLNLWNASEYDKAWGIYEYIANNVHYDYAHLSDSSYMLKYSAYAALCQGTAVCQGYAILYCKMARQLGLDCRMVIGNTSQGRHGWNIVRVGNYFYSIDVTWDSALRDQGMSGYKYFLKGEGNMDDHDLEPDYKSDTFRRVYPISQLDYSPSNDNYFVQEQAYDEYDNTPQAPNAVITEEVSGEKYYTGAVEWAVKNRLTNGETANNFAADTLCTRAEIIAFLWRAAGCPKTSYDAGFVDVPYDAYYRDAVNWAVRCYIVEGTSATTFSPDNICTRGQAVTFLHRASEYRSYKGGYNPFADVVNGAYYRDAVSWAYSLGIAKGTSDTTFSPDEICNRAQIVTFLYRFDLAVNH